MKYNIDDIVLVKYKLINNGKPFMVILSKKYSSMRYDYVGLVVGDEETAYGIMEKEILGKVIK